MMVFQTNTKAVSFHAKLHAHIFEEINKLTQLEIPEAEALTLVSEELILIFSKLFECHKTILDSEKGMDMATYTTRIIWASLKCHMEATDLLSNGISSIMLCCLLLSFISSWNRRARMCQRAWIQSSGT